MGGQGFNAAFLAPGCNSTYGRQTIYTFPTEASGQAEAPALTSLQSYRAGAA